MLISWFKQITWQQKDYINCQGTTRSKGMMKETIFLFQWMEAHLQSIKAEHMPRLDNLEADWITRRDVIKGEMGSSPRSVQHVGKEIRSARTRPLCIPGECQDTSILLKGQRSPGQGDQCSSQSVASGSPICLSSIFLSPTDFKVNQATRSLCHLGGSP